jgi:hypothetical protein
MPDWVQGLGRTAAQLNPRPEEIQARRLGVLGEEAKLTEQGIRLSEAQMYHRATLAQRADQTAKTFHEIASAAQKGELTDVNTTSQMLQATGVPKEKADLQAKTLVGISKEKQALVSAASAATDARQAAHLKEMARESDNRLAVTLKALTTKTSEKADADKAIEETAQALAPMNKDSLNAMTQVAGMFGSARNKIFARARELNPHFNTAELGRMMDMEKSFTVGKDSVNVQSFDTFLQHAGELHDALNDLYLTNSPALNKPLNWIRKNAAGDPKLQRLVVALEPVGKEFESFLLNQRALYEDDRRQISTLIAADSRPDQLRTALNQMGKTAEDRFKAMNHRYKNVMKEDLTAPFSEDAINAAKKIGLGNLGGAAKSGGGKDYGPAPPGLKEGATGNGGKFVVRNGRWTDA